MIEYVSVEKLVDSHIRAEKDPYTMGWNDGIQNALEKKNITRAVPEEAFEITKRLLKTGRDEARAKKEFAIVDQDTSTAMIKRNEELTYNFALQILEKLEQYGEEAEEMACTEN
jgi:hypothetical protein